MTPLALDIVIVNYNTRADLAACLGSLLASPPARPHTILVVDNASTDGSVEMVQRDYPAARVLAMPENAGFARANNAGIRATHAPLVLLLNSDTLVPAGALDILCERMAARRAVAAGPRLVDGRGRVEMSWGPMLSLWNEWIQARRVRAAQAADPNLRRTVEALTKEERIVDWVTGACLLLDRRAVEAVGLLDERYFMYEEDVDLCAALRAAGGTVLFTPAATVTHLRGRSLAAAPRSRSAIYDESHLKFYEKHAPASLPLLRLWKRLRR